MKIKLLSLCGLASLPVATLVASCSCGADSSQLSTIKDIVNQNFVAPGTDLGEVTSADEAKGLFEEKIIKSEAVQTNELLFDLFNFMGADGLTINVDGTPLQVLPTGYTVLKLFDESKCVLNCQYDYKFLSFSEEGYYNFIFQGWVTLQMIEDLSKDNVELKKGDLVQFVYDIQAWVKATVSYEQVGNDFYSKVSYQYMDENFNTNNNQNNGVSPIYGFVKLVLNEEYYPDFAISNLEDVNYAGHQLFKCSLA